ncbi:hypothetical protein P3S68_023798 [Capsicum galapagoense]
MATTKFLLQSILLLCLILLSLLALHHCDESIRAKSKVAAHTCIPLVDLGVAPKWCCTGEKDKCYASSQECFANCP